MRSRNLALWPSMATKQAKDSSVSFLTFTWLKPLDDSPKVTVICGKAQITGLIINAVAQRYLMVFIG
jgi:hypothetical protein